MARYKVVDISPRFIAVDLEKQLLPGSFAHAVHHLLDHDFDLSGFDIRYRNADTGASAYPDRMKRAIDSEEGRRLYGQRFATVEPVFGNIRHNKRLNRFTLRGREKVDTQWKLYCLVHNIERLAHHVYAVSG